MSYPLINGGRKLAPNNAYKVIMPMNGPVPLVLPVTKVIYQDELQNNNQQQVLQRNAIPVMRGNQNGVR